ncbi:MAG: hypothetical protein ABR583_01610 [Gaiellaceae bacterium]
MRENVLGESSHLVDTAAALRIPTQRPDQTECCWVLARTEQHVCRFSELAGVCIESRAPPGGVRAENVRINLLGKVNDRTRLGNVHNHLLVKEADSLLPTQLPRLFVSDVVNSVLEEAGAMRRTPDLPYH